jgi:hypothetical protein
MVFPFDWRFQILQSAVRQVLTEWNMNVPKTGFAIHVRRDVYKIP